MNTIFTFKGIFKKISRRNRLLALGVVVIFLIGLVFASFRLTKETEAAWFDDTYTYRFRDSFVHDTNITDNRAVTYTFDNAELITANLLQSDCDDIRFTDGNGKLLLHDLTSTCNSATATYEVIFPSIINGTNVFYIYYGNPTATNAEIDSTVYTALTPSGGDPSEASPTATDEQGPAPLLYFSFDEGTDNTCSGGTNDTCNGGASRTTLDAAQTGMTTPSATSGWQTEDQCVSGKCLRFDGSDDVVNAGSPAAVDNLASLTVTAWIKPDTQGFGRIANKRGATSDSGWKFALNNTNTLDFQVDTDGDDVLRIASNNSISLNKWNYVTATWDGSINSSNVHIYVNGVEVSYQTTQSASGSRITDVSNNLLLGKPDDASSFDGTIDEVKIYNYVRSAAQIQADFASRGTPKGTSAQFGPDNKWLSDGLVGYWKMDETATPSIDSSGNGGSGTWGGNAASSAGKFGNAISLDGTGDYIQVADNNALDITQTITLSAWIYSTDQQNNWGHIMIKNAGSGWGAPFGYYRILITSAEEIWLEVGNDSDGLNGFEDGEIVIAESGISINAWHHVAGTYDGEYLRVYVDGELKKSKRLVGFVMGTSAWPLHIGINDDSNSEDVDGKIDEARIYNRALSGAEVERLYNWAPGPVGYWKLDENTGTAANDSSGNGKSGTITNPSWGAGKFGPGLMTTQDNVKQVVTVSDTGDTFDVGASADFTINAWIKATDDSEGPTIVRKAVSTGGSPGYFLWFSNSGGNYEVLCTMLDASNEDDATYITGGATVDGNWHNYSCVLDRDGSEMGTAGLYLYMDGSQVASDTSLTVGSMANSESFFIGEYSTADEFGTGAVDNVLFYNYARTPKQIVEDMNAGHPAGGSPVGSQTIYWKFDEQQGTTANDTTAHRNGVVDSNTAWKLENSTSGGCKINGCLEFDAAGEEVTILTANDAEVDFNGTEQFTGSAWVYVATMPGSGEQDAIIAKWDDTNNQATYKLYVENDDADTTGNFEVQIYDESASQAITASQANDSVDVGSVGGWYHVSFTFNGGTAGAAGDLKLYVNGKFIAQNSANASFLGLEDLASDFTVGEYDPGDAVATNTAFTGRIDEVKIYSGLLTDAEIKIDANAGSNAALGGVLGTHDSEGFGGNPPVGWWKMDENTGSSAYDTSGNGSTGSWNGTGSHWGPGKFGSGAIFNGSDDYISSSSNATFNGGGTWSFWIYPQTKSGSNRTVASNTGNGCGAFTEQSGNNFRVEFNCYFVSQTGGWLSSFGIPVNQWSHVAITYDWSSTSNVPIIFINGISQIMTQSQAPIGTSPSPSGFYMGGVGSGTFLGRLDDVKHYNYIRTPAQIAYDYNRGAPVAWYKFDECQGTTANNAAPAASGGDSSMDGTITAGTSGGNNDSAGSCNSGAADPTNEMWNDGTIGKYNSSLGFDGTNDYVSVADNNSLDSTSDLSISLWVNANDWAGGVERTLVKKDENYILRKDEAAGLGGTGLKLYWWDGTDLDVHIVSLPSTSVWHHIVGTVENNTTRKIYVDGILQSGTDDLDNTCCGNRVLTNILEIGSGLGGTESFNGQIDDVKIFNYALSASQVKNLFNNGAVYFGPVTGSP